MIQAIRENLGQNKAHVAVFMARDDDFASDTISSPNDIYRVGTLAQIYHLMPGPNDTMTLLLFPQKRISIKTLMILDEPIALKKNLSFSGSVSFSPFFFFL
jgi:ATP-dependent Lon protease